MKRAVFAPLLTLQLAGWTAAVTSGQFDAVDIDHPAIRYSGSGALGCGRAAEPPAAVGRRAVAVRDTGRLPEVAAGGARHSRRIAAGGVFEDEPPEPPYQSVEPAGHLLQRHDGGRVGAGRIHRGRDPRSPAWRGVLHARSKPAPVPQLVRDARCLSCHLSTAAAGVPGFLMRSIPTAADGTTIPWLGNATTDHRTALQERWGGWYVTAQRGPGPHLGNALIRES